MYIIFIYKDYVYYYYIRVQVSLVFLFKKSHARFVIVNMTYGILRDRVKEGYYIFIMIDRYADGLIDR